ncbi:unnamed protein product [Agarophyton chilense]
MAIPGTAFIPTFPLRVARPPPLCGRFPTRMTSGDSSASPVEVPNFLRDVRVLGLGLSAVDLLAKVKHFPKADDKIRTEELRVFGGGNVANSLTGVRRLGVQCRLASKLGNDMYGRVALEELKRDGIDTRFVQIKDGVNTTFTYVIVDSTHHTRTCISTPAREDLFESDVNELMLDGVHLVMLDGRHTIAAIRLAQLAAERRIPVLLDIERNRPHIENLLPYADYIITNSTYPFVFSPEAITPAQALRKMLDHCRARFVISTRGSSGSILVRAQSPRKMSSGVRVLVQRRSFLDDSSKREYELLECPAWSVDKIVDTTGAGDAFIAGVAYGIVANMDLERMLSLASYVAATKLGALGSRTALPRREHIPDTLTATLPSL